MDTATPYSAADFAVGLTFGLVLTALLVFRWHRAPEGGVLLAAWGAKLLAALAYGAIYIYYYGGASDSLTYHSVGVEYADEIRTDLTEVTASFLSHDPFFATAGNSTTRFESLSGLFHYLLGDSFIAASLACALTGFAGQVCLYRVFVAYYPDLRLRRWLQAGLLFFPTLVFWSSGLLKDSIGFFGLGLAFWGVHELLEEGRGGRGGAAVLFGSYLLFLYRPHVLPPLFVALVPWVLQGAKSGTAKMRRPLRELLPLPLLAGSLAGFWLVTTVESRFSLSELPERFQREQRVYEIQEGGSTVEGTVGDEASWAGLVSALPFALVLTLYRPFPWEVSGVAALVGSLENLVLLGLSARALLLCGREIRSPVRLFRTPLFATCLLFVVFFGLAVGASTPNLGTVSRYRVPLIPFLVMLFVIVEFQALTRQGQGMPQSTPRRAAAGARPHSERVT